MQGKATKPSKMPIGIWPSRSVTFVIQHLGVVGCLKYATESLSFNRLLAPITINYHRFSQEYNKAWSRGRPGCRWAMLGPLGPLGVRWALGTGVIGFCRFCGRVVRISLNFCEGHQPGQQTASLLFEQGCLLVVEGADEFLNAVKCSATQCSDVQCTSLDSLVCS